MNKLQKTPIMKISDISKNFNDYMRKETEKMGLSCTYRNILFVLMRENGISQVDLCQKTFFKAPTISLTLQKMETDGVITRKQDEKDLRTTRVFITDEGKVLLEKTHRIAQELDDRISNHLTEEENKIASEIIDRILVATLEEVSKDENI